MLGSIILPMIELIVIGVAGMAVLCFVAAKILKTSFLMAFATALTALYGSPPTPLSPRIPALLWLTTPRRRSI